MLTDVGGRGVLALWDQLVEPRPEGVGDELPGVGPEDQAHGVTTLGVDDPNWPRRVTLAVTRRAPSAQVLDVVEALTGAGRSIR
jgi:hypothetical protein